MRTTRVPGTLLRSPQKPVDGGGFTVPHRSNYAGHCVLVDLLQLCLQAIRHIDVIQIGISILHNRDLTTDQVHHF